PATSTPKGSTTTARLISYSTTAVRVTAKRGIQCKVSCHAKCSSYNTTWSHEVKRGDLVEQLMGPIHNEDRPSSILRKLRTHRHSSAINMTRVQFGFCMPRGARDRQARGTFVEDLNRALELVAGHFDSAWIVDHLQFGDDDVLEGFTALSYMAALH